MDRSQTSASDAVSSPNPAPYPTPLTTPLRVAGDLFPPSAVGLVVIGVLGVVGIVLAYSSGAYMPRSWTPVLLAMAGLTLMLLVTGPPVRWSRGQLILLAAFAAQAAWTAASLLWAGSLGNAWEEANRTFLYLLGFALAAAGVSWAGRRGAWTLVATFLAVVGAVAVGGVLRLATAENLVPYFTDGRLHYPITYWNGLACLYMLGFWLALGLASGRPASRTWMWAKPPLLGLAVVLAELSLLPQSRGGFYAFFLVAPLFVALSPHRFRALTNLALVAGAVTLAWGPLTAVYPAVRGGAGLVEVHGALWAMLPTAGGAAVVCALTWLLELRAGRLGCNWVRRISVGIAVLILTGAMLGMVGLERRVGDLRGFARATWDQFTADGGPAAEESSRFTDVGLNGRLQQWHVAGDAFVQHPVLGVGAQNFEPYFYQHRTTTLQVRNPHSQPMQFLGELGLPGFLLYVFMVTGVLVRAGILRFRGEGDRRRLLLSTMLVAFLSWFVHSSVDWLWQLGGVSWPAVLLLGGLLAATPAVPSRTPRLLPLRWLAVGATSLILLSATLSFLASQYATAAQVNAAVSPATAVANARTAALFDRLSPLPTIRRAEAYSAGARQTAASSAPGRAWAVLDDLALSCAAWDQAVRKEPGDWVSAYRAAAAVLDYRDAALAAGVLPPSLEAIPPITTATTLDPWAGLRAPDAANGPSDPGTATSSLALSDSERTDAARFRALDVERLSTLARRYLQASLQLNPLGAEIETALKRI